MCFDTLFSDAAELPHQGGQLQIMELCKPCKKALETKNVFEGSKNYFRRLHKFLLRVPLAK